MYFATDQFRIDLNAFSITANSYSNFYHIGFHTMTSVMYVK